VHPQGKQRAGQARLDESTWRWCYRSSWIDLGGAEEPVGEFGSTYSLARSEAVTVVLEAASTFCLYVDQEVGEPPTPLPPVPGSDVD
jgi:hypothetical protein